MKNLFIILLPLLFVATIFNSCQKDPVTAPDPCANISCFNGGVCQSGTCDCPPGFSGAQCQIADPCHNITCFNGGTCANGSCNCPSGYSGSDCSVVLTPSTMTITRIEVTDYPPTKSNGSGWDPFDGADPFVVFHPGTGSNYNPQNSYISGTYSNVTGQDLTFTNGLPVTINSLGSDWSLDMWDQDASAHDFMTGVYFKPINKSNGFPNSFTVSTANFTARVYITWNF